MVEQLITEHLDLWTSAHTTRSTSGRGSSNKLELTGIKKLRELILELAMRGKLVHQETTEESASQLYEQIQVEKARLVKSTLIRKPKPLPKIDPEDFPYECPQGWIFCRLGDVTNYGATDKAEPSDVDDSTWVVELEDIEKSTSKLLNRIEFQQRPFKSSKNRFVKGDVLYGKLRPYLDKVLVPSEPGVCTTEIIPIRAYFGIEPAFLRWILKSPRFIDYANSSTHGMNLPRMGTDKARLAVLPLPPLAEQRRIIAKVDKLMALCDQLEQQTEDSISAHQTLVETLLATLTDSADAEELAQNWRRLAEHFDTLFTTEHSIEQLKQTILQLAVAGKLVTQHQREETAGVLLEKLAQARNVWLEANSDHNPECRTMLRKLSKLDTAKEPFQLPETWACAHLIQLSKILVDCHNKTAPYVTDGIPIIRTTNIRDREFVPADLKYVNEDTYKYWSRRCPPESGDIIFTREAPMGEALIIPEGAKWCLGQRTMLIRPMHDYVSNEYLLLALTEPYLLERASEHAIGSTVKHLRVGDVENLSIPVPPLEEQHRIVEMTKKLFELCEELKRKLTAGAKARCHLALQIVNDAVA